MSARLRFCRDQLDTPTTRWLLGRTDVTTGRVVLRPTGQAHGAPALIDGLLEALGVSGTQRRTARAHETVLDHVLPWLIAYRVRELVVHGHTQMTLAALEVLLDLVDAAGVRLWLLGRTTGERQRLLAERGATTASWDDVRAVLDPDDADTAADGERGDGTGPGELTEGDPGWPPMPADDFLTFRAAARGALTATQFAAVDTLYLATIAEAHQQLAGPLSGDGTLANGQPHGDRLLLDRERLEAAVAGYLHTLVARSSSAADLTVRMRAAQTAAFHLGWQLQVRLERLVATAGSPSAAAARDPRTWQILRLYRDPVVGSVLVLTALDCDVATMLRLPAVAVAADGCTVTVHGAALPTPPGAAVLLRAQRIAGQLAGRAPAEPFLHAAGEPLTDSKVVGIVHACWKDTGIPLASRVIDHNWNGRQWLERWGLCLKALT